jgi:hypothetical protein
MMKLTLHDLACILNSVRANVRHVHQVQRIAHRGKRISELVAEHCQELVFLPICRCEFLESQTQFLFELFALRDIDDRAMPMVPLWRSIAPNETGALVLAKYRRFKRPARADQQAPLSLRWSHAA